MPATMDVDQATNVATTRDLGADGRRLCGEIRGKFSFLFHLLVLLFGICFFTKKRKLFLAAVAGSRVAVVVVR